MGQDFLEDNMDLIRYTRDNNGLDPDLHYKIADLK